MANALPRAALALGLLITPFALCAQEGDKPKPTTELKATHGAWDVICSTVNGACAMEQKGQDGEGKDLLLARIARIEPRDTPQGTIDTVITVLVPLGVMLKPGLGVQIDSGEVTAGAYELCDRNGCVLQSPMPAAMVAAMKKGVSAKFVMVAPPNRKVVTSLSLSGFTAAFNSIQK
jgi:invasion protein IalB